MKVYNYHPETKEFLGIKNAHKSPLEKGVFLLPAHATFTECTLSQKDGFAICFIGDVWSYVEDNRGAVFYNELDEKIVCDSLGEVDDDWTTEIPEPIELTYQEKRRADYPDIGDQLDAIWKELNYRRMNGEELLQETDNLLGEILAVKKRYPKE